MLYLCFIYGVDTGEPRLWNGDDLGLTRPKITIQGHWWPLKRQRIASLKDKGRKDFYNRVSINSCLVHDKNVPIGLTENRVCPYTLKGAQFSSISPFRAGVNGLKCICGIPTFSVGMTEGVERYLDYRPRVSVKKLLAKLDYKKIITQ